MNTQVRQDLLDLLVGYLEGLPDRVDVICDELLGTFEVVPKRVIERWILSERATTQEQALIQARQAAGRNGSPQDEKLLGCDAIPGALCHLLQVREIHQGRTYRIRPARHAERDHVRSDEDTERAVEKLRRPPELLLEPDEDIQLEQDHRH